ncbi:MAG: thioredoxin [Ferruginibacter sp.]|nr:thioredoxin [Cytophagales bacterium]
MNRTISKRMKTGWLVVVPWLLTFAAAAQTEVKLTPDAFEKALAARPDHQLIDVRTREEYAKQRLKNALNLNYNGPDFESHLAYLDKTKPAYVYCLSGGRSAKAAERMRSLGFRQVYELDGGLLKWNDGGKPVEKPASVSNKPGLTAAAFDKLTRGDRLVLVDFGAKWCSPCKKMAPILDQVATDLRSQVRLVQVDVDANPELTKHQRVTELPALFLYQNGKVVWQQTGFLDEAGLKQVIATHGK